MRQIRLCAFIVWITSSALFAAADSELSAEGLPVPHQDLQPPLPGAIDSFRVDAEESFQFREKRNTKEAVEAPQTSLLPPHPDTPRLFNEDVVSGADHHENDGHDHSHTEDALITDNKHNSTLEDNEVHFNSTLHDEINSQLAHDEERVLSGGEVKIRKKRTFCKKCFPTVSYGYGGGGGCCGQCGNCGIRRPAARRVVVVPVVVQSRPAYGYGGGCGGGCGRPRPYCNVCGR